MTPYKLVNLLLALRMEILELMHGLELDDIETIGQNTVRFAFK